MSNRAADAMDAPFVHPKRKQSKDDSLRKVADRIQARAIRRCGELLKQHQARTGRLEHSGRPSNGEAAHTIRKLANDAGLSRHQQTQAVRIASVPDDEFNAAVESDSPPADTQAPCMPIEAIQAALLSVTDA
jgi:hypothetical protein